MGIVDSVMYPGTRSFARFEYPSRLPREVQARIAAVVRRFVAASGLDASCFNVEVFWDEATDALGLIEINPRMSYQFADIYERVDGTSTYAIQLALAAGVPATFRAGSGRDGAAASFVLRRFHDARVVRVPSRGELEALARRFPGATVKVLCERGERLSQHDQDVESFRYAIVNLGARTSDDLLAQWTEVQRLLRFEFA
jgi:biotin carboxylase